MLAAALSLLLLPLSFPAERAHAEDGGSAALPDGYRLSGDTEGADLAVLADKNGDTYLVLAPGESVTLHVPAGADPLPVHVRFKTLGGGYRAALSDSRGSVLAEYALDRRDPAFLFPALPGLSSVTVTVDALARLSVLRPVAGDAFAATGLRPFLPPLDKADLLVVSTHPDDEIVMFGGLLPTYAGERGYAAEVVYMTMQNKDRYREAHNGLWVMGVRHLPVSLGFRDAEGKSAERYRRIWGGVDRVSGALVSEIRRCRPLVVVTHDEFGEYGHGAHIVTSECVRLAVEAAGDPARYPESAARYGAWQVQKLYLHLSPEQPVTLDDSLPLAAFSGRTAMDVAKEAYACHSSQRVSWLRHLELGTYDSRAYGLVFSAVGADAGGNDLFEHIPAEALAGNGASEPAAE